MHSPQLIQKFFLLFDITLGNENYLKINRQDQKLKTGDILLRDNSDILANILYGPAHRTSITMNTTNSLYFAWSPNGINSNTITNHLKDILSNLELVSVVPLFLVLIVLRKRNKN